MIKHYLSLWVATSCIRWSNTWSVLILISRNLSTMAFFYNIFCCVLTSAVLLRLNSLGCEGNTSLAHVWSNIVSFSIISNNAAMKCNVCNVIYSSYLIWHGHFYVSWATLFMWHGSIRLCKALVNQLSLLIVIAGILNGLALGVVLAIQHSICQISGVFNLFVHRLIGHVLAYNLSIVWKAPCNIGYLSVWWKTRTEMSCGTLVA